MTDKNSGNLWDKYLVNTFHSPKSTCCFFENYLISTEEPKFTSRVQFSRNRACSMEDWSLKLASVHCTHRPLVALFIKTLLTLAHLVQPVIISCISLHAWARYIS